MMYKLSFVYFERCELFNINISQWIFIALFGIRIRVYLNSRLAIVLVTMI